MNFLLSIFLFAVFGILLTAFASPITSELGVPNLTSELTPYNISSETARTSLFSEITPDKITSRAPLYPPQTVDNLCFAGLSPGWCLLAILRYEPNLNRGDIFVFDYKCKLLGWASQVDGVKPYKFWSSLPYAVEMVAYWYGIRQFVYANVHYGNMGCWNHLKDGTLAFSCMQKFPGQPDLIERPTPSIVNPHGNIYRH